MTLKSKRIHHQIYQVTINQCIFEIDGQNTNGEEWMISRVFNHCNPEWIDTLPTKRQSLDFLENLILRN